MFSYQFVCPWETELLSFGKHGPCFELHYLKLKKKKNLEVTGVLEI